MRSLFFKSPMHEHMRTEPMLQFPLLQRQHQAFGQLVLDVELVLLVLAVAFVLHFAGRMLWSQFKLGDRCKQDWRQAPKGGQRRKAEPQEPLLPKATARGSFPRDLPPPTYGTGVFAKVVHEKLSGSVSEAELLPFLLEHGGSFSVANTVHAVVKCGKLQVRPGPAWLGLVAKVGGLVPRLKIRGLAHVLWGFARVQTADAEVVDAVTAALCGKWAELRGGDLSSAVWAVAELRQDSAEGPGYDRVVKVLTCAGRALQASLPSFTAEELASLLETLASPKLAPPPGVLAAPAAPLVVTTCTALLALSKKPKAKNEKRGSPILTLPDTVKVVGSLSALVQTGAVGADREPGELLRTFAARVADVKTAKGRHFRSAVATFTKLRVEDVGVAAFDKLARSAVLLSFAQLPRKQLVQLAQCLAPVAAAHALDCGSEFFLELAQQLNALKPALGRGEEDAVRAAFAQVGYTSMLLNRA